MKAILALLIVGLLGFCAPAGAQSLQDRVVLDLQRDGYSHIVGERTLLGRIRIRAARDGVRREIVINPSTGEILRDLSVRVRRGDDDGFRSENRGTRSDDSGSGSGNRGAGSGNKGSGDDDDDDDDDDDNSGSGSGNSGSGSEDDDDDDH